MPDPALDVCGCGLRCPWRWDEEYRWTCQPCHERRRDFVQKVSDMRLKAEMEMRLKMEKMKCE